MEKCFKSCGLISAFAYDGCKLHIEFNNAVEPNETDCPLLTNVKDKCEYAIPKDSKEILDLNIGSIVSVYFESSDISCEDDKFIIDCRRIEIS